MKKRCLAALMAIIMCFTTLFPADISVRAQEIDGDRELLTEMQTEAVTEEMTEASEEETTEASEEETTEASEEEMIETPTEETTEVSTEASTEESTEQTKKKSIKSSMKTLKSGVLGDNNGFQWNYDDETKTLTVTGRDSGLEGKGYSTFFSICYDVENIIFQDCTFIGSVAWLCGELHSLKDIKFINCDTSQVTNMRGMFYECVNLESVNLSGFNTSNVTDMQEMFFNCNKVNNLDVSGFDTSKVTHMWGIFYGCSSLQSIDVSGFDTSNVISMTSLFFECSSLKSIDVSGFDTSNVRSMNSMFVECTGLTELDVSGFNTSNVTAMGNMFLRCSNLKSLDVSGFDTSQVTDIGSMFYGCKNLSSLDVSGFDTSNVEEIGGMFGECNNIKVLNLSNFDLSNVNEHATSMLKACNSLETIYTPKLIPANISVDLPHTFYDLQTNSVAKLTANNCNQLLSINKQIPEEKPEEDTEEIPIEKPTSGTLGNNDGFQWSYNQESKTLTVMGEDSGLGGDIYSPFYNIGYTVENIIFQDCTFIGSMAHLCENLQSLKDVKFFNCDTSQVTDMRGMFYECVNLESVNLSGFNTSNVTDMQEMFFNCNKVRYLDVSGFDTSKVTDMWGIFYGCSSLRSIDVSRFDTSNVTDMTSLFFKCSSLGRIDVSGFDTSKVTSMSSMFVECTGLTELDVSGFDTSNVTRMGNMFLRCSNLNSLDVSRFDTSQVTDIGSMFYGCKNLSSLDVSGFNTSKVQEIGGMFGECSNIKTLDLGNFDLSHVNEHATSMLYACNSLETIYTPKLMAANISVNLPHTFYDLQKNSTTSMTIKNCNTFLSVKKEEPITIIDEVATYTLDEVYAQWDAIINSNFSHEEKMRRLLALASNYGITDVQEGIKYFSKISSHTRNYLYLTTNENYCAYDWAYWLNTTPSGKLARGGLYADGLIFNYEFLTYIDWTTYANGSFPGVEKCKTMLKMFIENKNDEDELVEIAQASKELVKDINNTIKLNDIVVDFRMEQIMDNVIKAKTKEDLLKYQKQFTNLLIEQTRVQQKVEEGGKVKVYLGADGISKAMNYAGPIIEIGANTIEDVIDIMNLESDIEKYHEYKNFLTIIYSSPNVSKEMRIAAYQLCDSLINSYIKEVQSILSNFIKFEVGMMYMDKGLLKSYLESKGLSTTATSLLGKAMGTITLATVISNFFIDAGDFVKQAAYTQGYAEIAALYALKLQEDKQAFRENPSEENAWKFYEDYNLLWRLRYEGEQQFLKMNTVKTLWWRIKTAGYNYREEIVKDVQAVLEQCKFELADNIVIPKSVQYVKKAVISCPVDVLVYTKEGVIVAELKNGVTSDITNEYGRFVVVYDSYSGEYIKVICQSTDEELDIQIVSVDDGLVDYQFAQNNTDDILYFDKVLVEAGDVINVTDNQYQVVHSTGGKEDVVQLGILNEEYIKPESVSLNAESLELFIGEEYVVETSVLPINTTNKNISWYSENEEVAEVKNGVIIAKSIGETVIHVKASDSDDVEKTIAVKVIEEIHTHDWQYDADGNIVKAKCIATLPSVCQYNLNELTLTVMASDGIYTGDLYAGISFIDDITSVTEGPLPNITYYKVENEGVTTGGIELEAVPIDVGYYYVSVMVEGVCAVKEFAILPKEIKREMISISEDSFVYDGTKHEPIISIIDNEKKLIEGVDYTLSGDKSAIDYGNLYKIKITGMGNYTGTVEIIWKIIDKNVPTGIISIKEDKWITLLNDITFGIFFKDTQTVTITAEDGESGIDKVYYYISNTKIDVMTLTNDDWEEIKNKGSFNINPDNKYIIYTKVVDNAGNITYVCSDGIVLDETAPIISNIENNGVYYEDTVFTVSDGYLDKVLVDDAEVVLVDGCYTILADNKEHIIKATDKAGNETEIKITVNYGKINSSVSAYEGTYDGNLHGITVSVVNLDDVKITYSTDGINYSEINPQFADKGEYTVYYKIEKERYATVEGFKTVTIDAKEIDITADDQMIMLGDTIDQSKYTVSNLLEGDSITEIVLTPSTSNLTEDGTINISNVEIQNANGIDVTNNYNITYKEGKLIIRHDDILAPIKIDVSKIKTNYKSGEQLNVDDLIVTAFYEDGYSEKVTEYTTNVSDIDMSQVGDKTLTISYTENGVTVTKDVEIKVEHNTSLEPTKIDVTATKTEYVAGESINRNTLVVTAYYEDGYSTEVTNYEIDIDMLKISDGKMLTISYTENGKTVTNTDEIIKILHDTTLIPDRIEVTKTDTEYIAGQELNVDDLIVTAYYEDGYSEKVTGCTTNAGAVDMTTAGEKILTVSFTRNNGTVTKDIIIKVAKGYTVTLPEVQTGYTVTADTLEALWNGAVNITFTLAEGYSKTEDFAVKVNGTEVMLGEDGTYTISNVLESVAVTVEGVADRTAPTAEVTVGENKWNSFLNTITFGLFFKETQSVAIAAEDAGSGMDTLYYYLSGEELTLDEVKSIVEWTEYNGTFNICPDNEYIIYAKAVDRDGNTVYVSSDGIVLDETAPVISGIADGSTYKGDITFSVADDYLGKVFVDDEEVVLTNGSHTIPADNKEHAVKVIDKAGNEISCTVTVNHAEMESTISGYSGTYDGQGHGIKVTVTEPTDAEITYSTDGVTYSGTNPQFNDKGTYTVYYRIEKDRYVTVEGSETVEITAREASITAADQSIKSGSEIEQDKYTVSGLLEGDRIAEVTLTQSTDEVTDNGTVLVSGAKIVNADGKDVTENYDISYINGKLVIGKHTMESTASGYSGTYDGQAHGITVTVAEPADAEITYSMDGVTYSGTNPQFTDKGIYTVYYRIEKNNYTTVEGSKTVEITAREISIVADDQSIKAGSEIEQDKYIVSGLLEGDRIAEIALTPSTNEVTDNGIIRVSRAKIVNASQMDVTQNYSISYFDGRLVIENLIIKYDILNGEDCIWDKNSNGLSIRGSGEFIKFVGVKVNGIFISEEYYSAEAGSTIVLIKSLYLQTLDAGNYTIEIVWTDGFAKTTFTILEDKADVVPPVIENEIISPDTKDDTSMLHWVIIIITAMIITYIGLKKKQSSKN